MFQASVVLDETAHLEIELPGERCHGCCVVQNDSLRAISDEPRIAEKLHKFSRAIRKYDIPRDVMDMLHDAEHTIEQFEKQIMKFEEHKTKRLYELQGVFIEEDIAADQELIPNTKPKWQPKSKTPLQQKYSNDVHNNMTVKIPT